MDMVMLKEEKKKKKKKRQKRRKRKGQKERNVDKQCEQPPSTTATATHQIVDQPSSIAATASASTVPSADHAHHASQYYIFGGFDPTNIFVKHLPRGTDDERLRDMFARRCGGEIVSCKVMVDPRTGNSLGYG